MSTLVILQALCWITLSAAGLLLLRAELVAHRHHLLSARGLIQRGHDGGRSHPPGPWHRLKNAVKRNGDRAVAVLLKVEISVAVVVALVLFVLWSSHQHAEFSRRSDTVLCGWLQDNC